MLEEQWNKLRKKWKRYPDKINGSISKQRKVELKQLASVPFEKAESKRLGLKHLNKSAERMGYEHPVNKQALKDLLPNKH